MQARIWNFETREYKPYETPANWYCPLLLDDMDAEINCANCGRQMVFGDGYTSRRIHNPVGLGYSVCEHCYEAERKLELSAKEAEGQ